MPLAIRETRKQLSWRMLNASVTAVSVVVTQRLLAVIWNRVTGRAAPDGPADKNASFVAALTWALGMGVGIAVSRLIGLRLAVDAWGSDNARGTARTTNGPRLTTHPNLDGGVPANGRRPSAGTMPEARDRRGLGASVALACSRAGILPGGARVDAVSSWRSPHRKRWRRSSERLTTPSEPWSSSGPASGCAGASASV